MVVQLEQPGKMVIFLCGQLIVVVQECGLDVMLLGMQEEILLATQNYAFHNMNVHTGGTYFKLAYITNILIQDLK